ncbi:F-box-like protein [Ceratobasidium sp. AG-Ba]|nr:F-box-like protein [Ceratobasidium sp. AG-Ba]
MPGILPPVNTLPVEIFTHIFEILEEDFRGKKVEGGLPPSFVCSGVCFLWRHIAIETPSLWTHINIKIGQKNYNCASLSLIRSKNLPVHLRISEPKLVPSPTSEELLNLLTEAWSRLHDLDIDSCARSEQLVYDILACWLDYGEIGVTTALRIQRPSISLFDQPLPSGWRLSSRHSAYSESVLQSVSVLHLKDIIPPWASTAYHDLVDLRLTFTYASYKAKIAVTRLADVFIASPALSTLKLSGLCLTSQDGVTERQIISLNYLKTFYLSDMNEESLRLILPILSFSGCSGGLSIGLHDVWDGDDGTLADFLLRTPARVLACTPSRRCSPFRLLSLVKNVLPSLDTLVLVGTGALDRREYRGLARAFTASEEDSSIRHLYIASGEINLIDLKYVIPAFGVRALHLDGCAISDIRDHNSPSNSYELTTGLLDTLLNITCIVSDTDTTNDWACRKMFDD